jgi:hypothetical protein
MVKGVYKWKPMLTRPLGRPNNIWEDDIINDMKKLKIKGLAASRIAISGNCVLRRPKHSKNEVVVPKEEEEAWAYMSCTSWRSKCLL